MNLSELERGTQQTRRRADPPIPRADIPADPYCGCVHHLVGWGVARPKTGGDALCRLTFRPQYGQRPKPYPQPDYSAY